MAKYAEGQFPPEPGHEHNWHVWCMTGALHVLVPEQYRTYLDEQPGESYSVNFGNGAYAAITPNHPLWQRLQEVSQEYEVWVFPHPAGMEYSPWTGKPDSIGHFDAIQIRNKRE